MRRRLCTLLQAMLLLFLLCTGHAASAAASELTWEYWQTKTPDVGAEEAKSVPSFPKEEGQWRAFDPRFGIAVPAGTRQVWIRVHIPPDTEAGESLFFSTTDQAVQIFSDGVSIYRYGDPGGESSYGRKWHLVNLPAWAVGRSLLMQVHSDNMWVLGQFDSVRLDREARQIENLFLYDFPYVSGVTALLVFIMLLAVYFFTEKELHAIYLRLIVLLAVFFVWMLSASNLVLRWLDWPVLWWHMQLISSYLIPIFTNLLLYRIIDDRYKKGIIALSCIYGLIFFAAVVLEAAGQNGLYLMRFFFYPALLICGLVTGYWLWACQKRGNKRCRSLLAAFAALSALAVIDGMSFQYRLFTWYTYFVPLGIYTVGFFIMQLILERAAHERYLSKRSVNLENKVNAVTKRMEIDPLTGVFNRNKFPAAMRSFMHIARETKEPFSLIIFDLDHFKRINDTYGHDAGDAVLAGFARLLQGMLDRRHVLIRWGGEEFILLCLHYDGAQAETFANRIREAVAEARLHPAEQVTCSGGVAVWYATDADTPAHVVKRADTALYEAKQSGRNRIACEPDWKAHMPPRTRRKSDRENG